MPDYRRRLKRLEAAIDIDGDRPRTYAALIKWGTERQRPDGTLAPADNERMTFYMQRLFMEGGSTSQTGRRE